MALAEGVEDAVAVHQVVGIPCWATLGTPGMRRVQLPREVRDVVLVPDRDGAGVYAARDLAYRLRTEGRRVTFRWPAAKDAAEEVRRGG